MKVKIVNQSGIDVKFVKFNISMAKDKSISSIDTGSSKTITIPNGKTVKGIKIKFNIRGGFDVKYSSDIKFVPSTLSSVTLYITELKKIKFEMIEKITKNTGLSNFF